MKWIQIGSLAPKHYTNGNYEKKNIVGLSFIDQKRETYFRNQQYQFMVTSCLNIRQSTYLYG